jgi:hypothetical protein
MKAIVVKSFRDKHTKALHKPGEEIEVSKKRFAEINSTPYGVLVEEKPKGEVPEGSEKDDKEG